jgi:hypothetical protein
MQIYTAENKKDFAPLLTVFARDMSLKDVQDRYVDAF